MGSDTEDEDAESNSDPTEEEESEETVDPEDPHMTIIIRTDSGGMRAQLDLAESSCFRAREDHHRHRG